MAEQQNVKIIKNFSENKIMANVDGDQMKQVFHNIIINALQAMPKGGKLNIYTQNIAITQSQTIKIPAFRLEFIDSGYGIQSDKLHEIFDFYYLMIYKFQVVQYFLVMFLYLHQY